MLFQNILDDLFAITNNSELQNIECCNSNMRIWKIALVFCDKEHSAMFSFRESVKEQISQSVSLDCLNGFIFLLVVNKIEQFFDVDAFVLHTGRENLMIDLLEILQNFVWA